MIADTTLRYVTVVQKDHKVEVTSPELDEGTEVHVYLVPRRTLQQSATILDLIKSFNLPKRSDEYWKDRERELREQRDSWDE